ncbi:MAG: glycosyltransferase [Candidatus Eisenbacteria bacterium]
MSAARQGAFDPAISVLLPVRDAAPTLASSLESLLGQRFGQFEVIAVDDGSIDATPRILADFARRDARVFPHRIDPGGSIAGALRAAVERARAPLLARFDGDDLAHPDRFGRQLDFLSLHPEVDLVATDVRRFVTDQEGERLVRGEPITPTETDGWRRYASWLADCSTHEQIALNLWIESPLPHPSVLFRRAAYEAAGGYRVNDWPEDYDLWLRMLASGARFAKLSEPLHYWRDAPTRASRTQSIYRAEAFLACRAHHLARAVGSRALVVWGAGRDGRRAARALLAEGATIDCFLDIDPRKIGRTAHGRPIVGAEEWLLRRGSGRAIAASGESNDRPLVLAAVGTAGARELIRARLEEVGMAWGPDYLAIA